MRFFLWAQPFASVRSHLITKFFRPAAAGNGLPIRFCHHRLRPHRRHRPIRHVSPSKIVLTFRIDAVLVITVKVLAAGRRLWLTSRLFMNSKFPRIAPEAFVF